MVHEVYTLRYLKTQIQYLFTEVSIQHKAHLINCKIRFCVVFRRDGLEWLKKPFQSTLKPVNFIDKVISLDTYIFSVHLLHCITVFCSVCWVFHPNDLNEKQIRLRGPETTQKILSIFLFVKAGVFVLRESYKQIDFQLNLVFFFFLNWQTDGLGFIFCRN